ncbi:hypothetical protein R5O87_06815 [Arthrobacter globiformis]|uniref:hypothetical protein n=1 Tax=Arthrobacter globiformis TaxID=1665 RepID=UPI00397DC345
MADAMKSLTESFRNVGVSRAYGDPIRLGGKEIIPVALVSFGFGGGTEGGDPEGAGSGGGGGGLVFPLGVYTQDDGGRLTFRPNPLSLMACLVPLVCAAGLALRGALRARR